MPMNNQNPYFTFFPQITEIHNPLPTTQCPHTKAHAIIAFKIILQKCGSLSCGVPAINSIVVVRMLQILGVQELAKDCQFFV
jgi:hypothetical protein